MDLTQLTQMVSWLDEEHPALEAVGIVTTHCPLAYSLLGVDDGDDGGGDDDAVQLN